MSKIDTLKLAVVPFLMLTIAGLLYIKLNVLTAAVLPEDETTKSAFIEAVEKGAVAPNKDVLTKLIRIGWEREVALQQASSSLLKSFNSMLIVLTALGMLQLVLVFNVKTRKADNKIDALTQQ